MILEAIAGAAIAVAAFAGWNQHQKTLGQLREARASNADVFNRALQAERDKSVAEQELDFIQKSVMTMVQRSVVASLTDAQVNNIIGALVQYANAVQSPEKMN